MSLTVEMEMLKEEGEAQMSSVRITFHFMLSTHTISPLLEDSAFSLWPQ